MRNLFLASTLVLAASAVGCAPSQGVASTDSAVAQTASAIVGGASDTTHGAVVALLSAKQTQCTGTIVAVDGTTGYVLTAAQCCATDDPMKYVVQAADYGPSAALLFGLVPPLSDSPPVYDVIAGSAVADPAYDGKVHDVCVLKFKGATSSLPVIPVATPAQDALAVGSTLDIVGYGDTSDPTGTGYQNSKRLHITKTLNAVTADTVTYAETSDAGGACEGDGGGPGLVTVNGVTLIAAITSYFDPNCAKYGVSTRISGVYTGFLAAHLPTPGTGTSTGSGTGTTTSTTGGVTVGGSVTAGGGETTTGGGGVGGATANGSASSGTVDGVIAGGDGCSTSAGGGSAPLLPVAGVVLGLVAAYRRRNGPKA